MTELPFLDHGLVRVRDVMGDDLTVVNAARVSFDAKANWKHADWEDNEPAPFGAQHVTCHGLGGYCEGDILKPADERLIQFLAEGGHWSPFAHPQISLEIYLPGMVLDQLVKHRIGMIYSDEESFVAYENSADNQLSMRYKEPVHFYVPSEDAWRLAPENKKQGSGPGNVAHLRGALLTRELQKTVDDGLLKYKWALEAGAAPEQARLVLPYYAMYTRRMWTSSLMGIIRFLQLREKPDAQYEIRELAGAVHRLLEGRFPYSFRAYGIGTGGNEG